MENEKEKHIKNIELTTVESKVRHKQHKQAEHKVMKERLYHTKIYLLLSILLNILLTIYIHLYI